jgi:hypothetical protein
MRAKILWGRDDAGDVVIGELSHNDNQNDVAELTRIMSVPKVRGIGEVAVRH